MKNRWNLAEFSKEGCGSKRDDDDEVNFGHPCDVLSGNTSSSLLKIYQCFTNNQSYIFTRLILQDIHLSCSPSLQGLL
jgi:hypothetical protein